MDVDQTLAERGAIYGDFAERATVSQEIKRAFMFRTKALRNMERQTMDHDQEEALEMIASKISRILCGDPDCVDSWHDIAGYAQLVANRLREDS